MNFKHKLPKMRNLFHLNTGTGCDFQDSMSLIRKRRKRVAKSGGSTAAAATTTTSSSLDTATGMSTLCTIQDGGLDTCPGSDSDSSIEELRDACSTMPTGNLILPDIVVDKPVRSPMNDSLEDTLHLNIKNSTMNHSAVAADIDDMDVENLSPIKKGKKKRKRIKLLDVEDQPLTSTCVSREISAVPEYQSTGNTPRHVRAVMNKLRAAGRKDESVDVDINYNSLSLDLSKTKEQHDENTVHDEDEDSEEEWSPTKMVRRPLTKRNWLHPNELGEKQSAYLHPDVIPEWKKCISKPQDQPCQMSFRTSSPSPYNRSNVSSVKDKRALLQISSIRESDTGVSINILNFESFPKHTINSDEIAPFSIFSMSGTDADSAEELEEKNGTKPPDEVQLVVDEIPISPCEENHTVSVFKSFSVHVKPEVIEPQVLPAIQSSSLTPIDSNKHSSNATLLNVSVDSDIISHLPSPEFAYKHTGKKAPSYSGIPNDEIGYL